MIRLKFGARARRGRLRAWEVAEQDAATPLTPHLNKQESKLPHYVISLAPYPTVCSSSQEHVKGLQLLGIRNCHGTYRLYLLPLVTLGRQGEDVTPAQGRRRHARDSGCTGRRVTFAHSCTRPARASTSINSKQCIILVACDEQNTPRDVVAVLLRGARILLMMCPATSLKPSETPGRRPD